MDDKTKTELRLFFNQGFEEVVMPQIGEIRDDIQGIKKDIHDTKKRLDRIEGTLDGVEHKLDLINDKLLTHDRKIKAVETGSAVAHNLKKPR